MDKVLFNVIKISDVKDQLGQWCKSLRKQQGLSQEELGKQLNLSRLTIQHLESGRNSTLDTLLKVLNHFQEMDELYQYIQAKSVSQSPKSLY
ncbi:XRE family transcriptional regulator [Cytophagaceae bacterium 50C-KIRBA]|uniref:XRE family transcriptional regulator n=1 Tax=Aquirufa beregesia TaxID=2516556 RepID=A0ABX0F077_9BACT|nr:helix-turn-helix transcriptional regulator [Aquirufa beregesia]NGZ45172.1 XRE family transcriptional regulator [Aquirufa beregesia]